MGGYRIWSFPVSSRTVDRGGYRVEGGGPESASESELEKLEEFRVRCSGVRPSGANRLGIDILGNPSVLASFERTGY